MAVLCACRLDRDIAHLGSLYRAHYDKDQEAFYGQIVPY